MMKRPRSFIATLLILIGIALSIGTLAVPTSSALAGTTTRFMNPIAGDPDEPGSGAIAPPGNSSYYPPEDPIFVTPVFLDSGPTSAVTEAPSIAWFLTRFTYLLLPGRR